MSVASEIAFELESLRWKDGELVLIGRWSGVRGVRFVRPTLISGDGGRLLASLDDKPWTAEEGEPWRAGFPCAEAPADDATFTLSVGGGIELTLGAEAAPTGRFPRPAPARDDLATRFDLLRSERDSALTRLDTMRSERHDLGAAKERAEADLRRVARERDALKEERDTVRKERTQARRALKSAEKKRDAALKDLEGALLERDDAHERSAILARDRDELAATISWLRAELETARSQPAPPPPPVATARVADPAPLPSREFTAGWRRPSADAPDRSRQRLLAALALLAVLVLAVLVLAL